MLDELKSLLIQIASYFSLYEIGLLFGIFFIFIFFFTLGLLLRGRRFIAYIVFAFAVMTLFSPPIVLQLAMQKVFYVTHVEIHQAYPMQYTKGFFVAGQITNQGRLPISECHIVANEVRDEKGNMALSILNTVLPIQSFATNLKIDIEVGKSAEFAVLIPEFKSTNPFYRVYVDCYLSNQLTQSVHHKDSHSSLVIQP